MDSVDVDEFEPTVVRAANTTPLYTHAFRWSYPKALDGNVEALAEYPLKHTAIAEALVAIPCTRFIFQLEKTVVVFPGDNVDNEADVEYGVEPQDNWHYQGYFSCAVKTRAVTLGRKLGTSGFAGIQVSPSSTLGREALKTYSLKEATREDGPWADRPLNEVRDEIEMADP